MRILTIERCQHVSHVKRTRVPLTALIYFFMAIGYLQTGASRRPDQTVCRVQLSG